MDRRQMFKNLGAGWDFVVPLPLVFVRSTNPESREATEHIDLGQRDTVYPVETSSRASDNRIKPAAAPRPASDRAELATITAQFFTFWTKQFSRKRTAANSCGIRLRDTNHPVDLLRSDPCTGT